MEDLMRAHERPAQTRAICNRLVDVLDAREPRDDGVDGLAPDGGLQTVDQVPRRLPVQANGGLAGGVVEVERPVDDLRGGLRAAQDLDQRDQVRWIERMPEDVAFPARAAPLQLAQQQARGGACHDRVRGKRRVEALVKGELERFALGSALLNELHAAERVRRVVTPFETRGIGIRRQAESLQRGPGARDEAAHPLLACRCRIPGPHAHAAGEKVRGPGSADGSGADDGDAFDFAGTGKLHGSW